MIREKRKMLSGIEIFKFFGSGHLKDTIANENSKIRSLNESQRKFCVDNDMTSVDNTNRGAEALQKGGITPKLHRNDPSRYEFQATHEVFLGTKAWASDDIR